MKLITHAVLLFLFASTSVAVKFGAISSFTNADMDMTKRNFSNQLKYANSRGVPFIIIIGEKELKEEKVKIRDMRSGEEALIPFDNIEEIKEII